MRCNMEFNIQRQGREWSRDEIEQKYYKLCPEKIELIKGRMFWTDEQRLNMLALLLENVGMDAAVSLGDPALWKQAIDERLKNDRTTLPLPHAPRRVTFKSTAPHARDAAHPTRPP